MSQDERFDGILLTVAQQAGSIETILDAFFGFLLRKTDFFSGCEDDKKAEKMVVDCFHRYLELGKDKREEEKEKNRKIDEERRIKAAEKKNKELQEYEKGKSKIEEVPDDTPVGIAPVVKKDKENVDPKKEYDPDDDNTPPPIGNGGSTDKFTWTQTLGQLEIAVPVRPGIKSRDVVVDIGVEKLKVQIKGEAPIILGKTHAKVMPDDSMWTLLDNKCIQISLEKQDQMKWWSCVMEGDPEINTRKIVPENSKLSDLDGDTRQTVEKMMYDQKQKAAGLPTSDQQSQHDMLAKFKEQHPEMDFSKCKVNYGGTSGAGGFNLGQ